MTAGDYIPLSVIQQKYIPMSRRTLSRMCEERVFQTAWKPGKGTKNSQWRVARAEVAAHCINNYPDPGR